MLRSSIACACLMSLWALPLHAQRPAYTIDTLNVAVGSRLSSELPVVIRAVEVITADDLARQPVRAIQEALARAFGVDVSARSPAQADIAIRGGSVEQVLVLVDGMRVSDAQTGHFDLELAVPLAEVDRIEILRGPASAQYGADAVGGVVNIVTRRPEAGGLHSRIEGGSFQTWSASAGAHHAGSRFRAGGTGDYRRSDGHRPGTDYRIMTGRIALEAMIAERPLRATIGIADREFGAANFYTSPESDFDEFEATRVVDIHISWDAPRASRLTVEPRLSARRHDDDFLLRRDDPSLYRNVHRTWQLGGDLIARYTDEHIRVAAGGEAYRDEIESTNLGDREESRGALFGEAGLGRPGSALGTAGVRADWHSSLGTFVAPSVGGALWLRPELHMRASLSRAFRAPTWTDRFYSDPANTGDPALKPERAWEGELGLELRIADVRTSLSVYVRRTTNLIDWARSAGSDPSVPWQTMNVEEATFRGVEFALYAVDFFGARWTARANAISFDAREADDYESKYALRPLTREASLDIDRPILAGVDLSARAGYRRRAEDDGYVQVDMRLSRKLRDARVSVDLKNLTGAEHVDISGMPAPGRAVRVGVDWALRR